ncbi:MAG TPA: toxin-antitoxin system TumE family protein [Candidatus Wunengus sp. YC61]|uniref:toxin-antitoxin system TumE family protein n=1 Tax=Candidatus Wunengus sp. YC61 TaxID=3367698 RepID=UPI004028F8E9
MRAKLIYHDKVVEAKDCIIEITIWSVPTSVDKPQGYKYSLVYIKNGSLIVGYDNAEDKGDHRHYADKEEPYKFKSINKLFEDFYIDLRRVKIEG